MATEKKLQNQSIRFYYSTKLQQIIITQDQEIIPVIEQYERQDISTERGIVHISLATEHHISPKQL